MPDSREPDASKRQRLLAARILLAGIALAGVGIAVTTAAWTDNGTFASTAGVSTYDIQSRFSSTEEWQDVGLPGNPDTYPDGFEIVIPPVVDALPEHSYVGDVFLCNTGDVDAEITDATLEEVTTTRDGVLAGPGEHLIERDSILVENIDIGTIIPALSCTLSSIPDPPLDVEGIIHFTTDADFTGHYGDTSRIVIKITVTSVR